MLVHEMERLLGTLSAFHMQVLRVHLGSCGAPSCYGAPSLCLVSGRQPKRTAVATRQSVVGACKQPSGSQLLTLRQLRWVVLDAPGATLAEGQAIAGFSGGADAPGATLAESQAVAGE